MAPCKNPLINLRRKGAMRGGGSAQTNLLSCIVGKYRAPKMDWEAKGLQLAFWSSARPLRGLIPGGRFKRQKQKHNPPAQET